MHSVLLKKLETVLKATDYGRVHIPMETPLKRVLFTSEKRVRIETKDVNRILQNIHINLKEENLGAISVELRGADRPCDLVYEFRYYLEEESEEKRGSETRM